MTDVCCDLHITSSQECVCPFCMRLIVSVPFLQIQSRRLSSPKDEEDGGDENTPCSFLSDATMWNKVTCTDDSDSVL